MTLRFQGDWLLLGIQGARVYGLTIRGKNLSGSDYRWYRKYSGIRPDMMIYLDNFGRSYTPHHYLLSDEEVLTLGEDTGRLLVSPFSAPTDINLIHDRLWSVMGLTQNTTELILSILHYPASLGGLTFATSTHIATDRPGLVEYDDEMDAFSFAYKP